ncbi:hypothetical protein AB9F29_00160 [Falsihalocynthiibacter sp. S25ZX9]|uniref:hypothetical protein n=1 Tax=Falsihalocynthiibacter sp. S25ZX9 TaxID=3240870 RepID=UPI00351072D6
MQSSQKIDRAIADLPRHAREFFTEVSNSAEFICHPKKIQIQVKLDGKLLGGFNRDRQHWYLTKRFIDRTSGEKTAAIHGFQETPRPGSAPFWRLDGAENAFAFKAALEDLIGSKF